MRSVGEDEVGWFVAPGDRGVLRREWGAGSFSQIDDGQPAENRPKYCILNPDRNYIGVRGLYHFAQLSKFKKLKYLHLSISRRM